jgi:hypothetical protein
VDVTELDLLAVLKYVTLAFLEASCISASFELHFRRVLLACVQHSGWGFDAEEAVMRVLQPLIRHYPRHLVVRNPFRRKRKASDRPAFSRGTSGLKGLASLHWRLGHIVNALKPCNEDDVTDLNGEYLQELASDLFLARG